MEIDKVDFLKRRFVPLLGEIPSDTEPQWGKMSLQQMVEHFADSVRLASGKVQLTEMVTPEEMLPKYQAFLMSDKPFRENTVNPILPEAPPPVRNKTIEEALDELQKELDTFFAVFEANHQERTRNPIYGDLDFTQNVQLLYKHALHHLRQFGVTVS
jgi:hypothetical protein